MLLYVFLFAVVPLAVYGIYAQVQAALKRGPIIEATLTTPYGNALKEGRFEEAYRTFTSLTFQSHHSLETFTTAQVKNNQRFGELREIRTHRAFQAAGNLFSGRSYYQGGLTYRYDKSEVMVVWEIAREGEGFRIDAMFEDREDTLTPGIY